MTAVSEPKRILHFISSHGLYGAEQIMLTLAKRFNDQRYRTIVGVLDHGLTPRNELVERAKSEGLKTITIKSHGRFDVSSIGQLLSVIKKENIRLLHTHNYKSNAIGWITARLAGIPVVATAHGFTDVTRAVSFYERLDRFFLKFFFDRVVVVTPKILDRWNSPKKRLITNGLDIERFNLPRSAGLEIRKRFGIAADDFVIGTIGRLSREKNQRLLLQAVRDILKNNSKVKILLVGDGPEKENLERFAGDNGISGRVFFSGLVSDPAPFYQAMDIFVLSSETEGIPLVILEAMAAMVPVVATSVGGVPEILSHEETGILVPAASPGELNNALNGLINDELRRKRLVQNAYEILKERFSLVSMCERYRRLYEEL